jgi:hypothetical protein
MFDATEKINTNLTIVIVRFAASGEKFGAKTLTNTGAKTIPIIDKTAQKSDEIQSILFANRSAASFDCCMRLWLYIGIITVETPAEIIAVDRLIIPIAIL